MQTMTENLATLIQKRGPIRKVGVFGMGYVGIPAAALFADVPHFEHVYGWHKEYRGLEPEQVKRLCESAHPAVVDGRNVVDPDAWIAAGFVYHGIGRGDKNRHALSG